MTTGPRITLKIGRIRVHGASAGDAAAWAEGLRTALAAQLAANPGSLAAGPGMDHLRVSLPSVAPPGPAALGRLAGHQIAGALTGAKGGR